MEENSACQEVEMIQQSVYELRVRLNKYFHDYWTKNNIISAKQIAAVNEVSFTLEQALARLEDLKEKI
jgi:hypothetical protein